MGNTTYKYDNPGELIEVDQPQVYLNVTLTTPITKYVYDNYGNEIEQIDANNHNTTFTFNALGQEIERTLPDNESESFTYDQFGNQATHTDFDGNLASNTYSALGQLTSTTFTHSGEPTQSVVYTYTALGQIHTTTDDSGVTTNYYDAAGNLTEVDSPEGIISYNYNNLNQQIETYTDGENATTDISYVYDSLGRLTQTVVNSYNGNSPDTPPTTYDYYDADGNLAEEVLANGDATAYTYNSVNNLISEVTTNNSGTTLFSQAFTLNADGLRTAANEMQMQLNSSTLTINTNWSYDADDRLVGETATYSPTSSLSFTNSYTYDLDGNRLTENHVGSGGNQNTTYTYNGDNELTSSVTNGTTTNYTYDAQGNQTNDGTHKYVYDVRNRMVELTDESGNVQATYVYDDAGDRVEETTDGISTFYLIDSHNPTDYRKPIEQWTSTSGTRSNATLAMTYVIGIHVYAQVPEASNATETWLLTDGGGSTRLLLDSSGNVTANLNYDAFGNPNGFNPATIGTIFQFGGDGMYDYVSGLEFHGSGRQSNSIIGRFITEDDQYFVVNVSPTSDNLFVLDDDDPGNRNDPSGHISSGELLAITTISGALLGGLSGETVAVYKGYRATQARFWEWTLGGALVGGGLGYAGGLAAIRLGIFAVSAASVTVPTIQQAENEGYGSREALNAAWRDRIGQWSTDLEVHHFVEQGQGTARFGMTAIQSMLNSTPISIAYHGIISAMYSSGPNILQFMDDDEEMAGYSTLRAWMQRQDWDTQWRWGYAIYQYVIEHGTRDGFNPSNVGLR